MNDDDDYIDDDDMGDENADDMYLEDEEKELEAELEAPKPAVYNTKEPWKILTRKELQQENQKLIDKTNERLFLEPGDCALLLQSFKWNDSQLLSRYWDDPEKTCADAGVSQEDNRKELDPAAKVECLVCCDLVKGENTFSLKCGHGPYCKECWKNHIDVAVHTTGVNGVINLRCMWPKCPIKLGPDAYEKLATPEALDKFQFYFLKYWVDCTPKLSFCPSSNCGNAVFWLDENRGGIKSSKGKIAGSVKCHCGTAFCFSCGRENHRPIDCKLNALWFERNSDDQESLKLIQATSKPCYHCKRPTTRNEGCNHMTCRKEMGGCGGEWCWMCKGDWATHGSNTGGYFSCNIYEGSKEMKEADNEVARVKAELERYNHYFERFIGHQEAKRAIPKFKDLAKKKADEYRETVGFSSVEFFMEGVELLEQCRHFLKYTYVFGFYLPDGSPGKDFFESLQASAEGFTERLADQVKAPLKELNVSDFKNRIAVTRKYMYNLVDAIERGLGVEGLQLKTTN